MKNFHKGRLQLFVPAFLCILAIMAVLIVCPLLAAQKTALITDLKGTVNLTRGSATSKTRLLQALQAGDILTSTNEFTKITISLASDGSTVSLAGVFKVRVEENGIYNNATSKKIKGKEFVSGLNIKPHAIELANAGAENTRAVSNDIPSSLYPYYLKTIKRDYDGSVQSESVLSENILTQRPNFMWNTLKIKTAYKFLFIDCLPIGKEPRRKINIQQQGFARYPKNVTNLGRGGQYMWWLSNEAEGEIDTHNGDQEFCFDVLSNERAATLVSRRKTADQLAGKDDISPYTSLIFIYMHNKLYGPALDLAYRIKNDYRPGDPAVMDLLKDIYGKLGLYSIGADDTGDNKLIVQQWENLRKIEQEVKP